MWTAEHSLEIAASPETIWSFFRDVNGWKKWNAGIEEIALHGPFAVGTEFTMKPPGQEELRSRLVVVRENEIFVDETRAGDIVVIVAHRIERLGPGRVRVTYAVEATGPASEEIGPAVSADFPDVLKALARLAEVKP